MDTLPAFENKNYFPRHFIPLTFFFFSVQMAKYFLKKESFGHHKCIHFCPFLIVNCHCHWQELYLSGPKKKKHQWNIKMCTRHKHVELHLWLCFSGQGFWIISLLRGGFMTEQSELALPQSLEFFNLPRVCTSQCRVSTQACSFISKACKFLVLSR